VPQKVGGKCEGYLLTRAFGKLVRFVQDVNELVRCAIYFATIQTHTIFGLLNGVAQLLPQRIRVDVVKG